MKGANREVVATNTVPEAFRDAESYAATKAHELTHWTKHPSRLERDFGGKRFGDNGYAREELVAELGAAFLCADLSITRERREDKPATFPAAAHAQRAVDFLHSLSRAGATLQPVVEAAAEGAPRALDPRQGGAYAFPRASANVRRWAGREVGRPACQRRVLRLDRSARVA